MSTFLGNLVRSSARFTGLLTRGAARFTGLLPRGAARFTGDLNTPHTVAPTVPEFADLGPFGYGTHEYASAEFGT